MTAIHLEREHALVGAVVLGTWAMSQYLGLKVGSARRQYNVKYPTMYAEGDSKNANLFNCVQRGHQNFLETVPTFLTLLVLGGVYYPLIAAALGALFLVSRISYASGYATGDPKKRYYGSYGIPGQLGLLGLSIHAMLKFAELI